MIFLPIFPYLRVIFPYLRVFKILPIFPYLRVFFPYLRVISVIATKIVLKVCIVDCWVHESLSM
jgi:hypothetical protein